MTGKKETAVLKVESQDEALGLFGHRDENLKFIEREMAVSLTFRNGEVTVTGARAEGIVELMRHLLDGYRSGRKVAKADIKYGLMLLKEGDGDRDLKTDLNIKLTDGSGRTIKPRSPRQRDYLEALANHDMVFAIGPAGTGKTYLAVAVAVKRLLEESVKRIIICRPAVEAGEKLGFLPGDMQQKVDPYLRPIYDALFGMMNVDRCARLLERGIIEVAPLAYMRGRTLDDAFVIMDEAQNTTIEQMKMFLTRLGPHARAAVTGDITQIDLPPDKTSGLVDAAETLKKLKEIRFIYFTRRDVVRHDLVAKIIKAYEDKDRKTDTEEDDEIAGQED
jgi:phosphate starvation-inducible protein PhoH and related proteins